MSNIYIFFSISDWSLNKWYKDTGFNNKTKLSSEAVLLLLDTLGIGEYLSDNPCDRKDHFSVYASQYEGWTTGMLYIVYLI